MVLSASLQVPPRSKGFLHIRPLLIGNGPVLSLTPAPEFTFLICVSPMGNYFEVNVLWFFPFRRGFNSIVVSILWWQQGGLQPINLVVENEIHRAVRGGAGSVKAVGNYSAVSANYHMFTLRLMAVYVIRYFSSYCCVVVNLHSQC